MQKFMKYFGESVFVTLLFLGIAGFLGAKIGGLPGALTAMMTTAMLGILETSLSFDNAVVNAKILNTMSEFWRKMFLTVGMIIAVFGMRIVFPIVIVWAVSSNGFFDVVQLTWKNPGEFQKILVDQHIKVAGFGGAFLWMVFAKFFFDREKESHWLGWMEKHMSSLGKMESVWTVFALAVSYAASRFMGTHGIEFFMSAVVGVITYLVVDGISSLVESEEEHITHSDANGIGSAGAAVAKAGFTSFLYLEVLDASFSFDGVIGSFAITNNLAIIALGLGIGAMFVRSFTIKLVDDSTLANYRFLENGAFWAIGALASIMYISAAGLHVPEVVSGLIGFTLIALAFISSVLTNKKEATHA